MRGARSPFLRSVDEPPRATGTKWSQLGVQVHKRMWSSFGVHPVLYGIKSSKRVDSAARIGA